MAFNLSKKSVKDTATIHLVDPETDTKLFDDNGQAVVIEIYGKASKQYRDALSALSRKGLQRKGKPQSFETNVADNVEILVAVSKTSNLELADGTAVTNSDAFRSLYSDPTLFWVKDQVQESLEDTTLFLTK